MLLREKGIPDATVLKLVSKLLKRNPSSKGFRIKVRNGTETLTYDEVVKFVDNLASQLASGGYGEIRRCDTCGNFSRPGARGMRGWCFPKERTSFKDTKDYCSGWIPMDEQQKYIRERFKDK